ncbi:DUF6438 domain-containing protein [Chitinophagaceae bacterium MMS25-I14]
MKKNIISTIFLLMTAIAANAQKVPEYVRMGRTACFGRCPIYSVEIYKNGLVRYSGQMFTQHQGVYEKKITKTKAAQLLKQFSSYRPDTCSAIYEKRIPDLPGMFLVFNYGDKQNEKKIINADSGPFFLKSIGRTLDSLGGVNKSWKKVADTAIVKY